MVQTEFAHSSSLLRFFSVLSVLLPNGCTVSGGMKGEEISGGVRELIQSTGDLCVLGALVSWRGPSAAGVFVLLVVQMQ